MSPNSVRIFISSPGDVQHEREIARDVVQSLQKDFAGRLCPQAIVWEDLPLRANASFQHDIDLVLSEHGVDIAVFILWARLGSPTVDNDGRQYRSGTEREWRLMLSACQQAEQQGSRPRPILLVYKREDDESYDECQRGKKNHERAIDLQQKIAVDDFVREEFQDLKTGANLRAYHVFDRPGTFAKQIRTHLKALLDSMALHQPGQPVWDVNTQGPVFRGLSVFEFEHWPIFFGREDEIIDVRNLIRQQARKGCAFLLISGASGTGKSSLARAGILPEICQYEIDADVPKWRHVIVKPNELGDDLTAGFIKLLMSPIALPEIGKWEGDIAAPHTIEQTTDWLARLVLRVKDALDAGNKGKGGVRLLILVDQLEELFSNSALSPEQIELFFQMIEALARSGRVWAFATVRSDFSHECQRFPTLVRMKNSVSFDVVSPPPDAIRRIVTRPAELAGLRFEMEGQISLSDAILREAASQTELLPLIEYVLLDLFEHRTPDGVLPFSRFRDLGGVEGALRQRCESTFSAMPSEVQSALPAVLSKVVCESQRRTSQFSKIGW